MKNKSLRARQHTQTAYTRTRHTHPHHIRPPPRCMTENPHSLQSEEHFAPNEMPGIKTKGKSSSSPPKLLKNRGTQHRGNPHTQHMFCVYKHQHTRTQRDSVEKLSSSDRKTIVEDMRRQVKKSGPPTKKATIDNEHHMSTPNEEGERTEHHRQRDA